MKIYSFTYTRTYRSAPGRTLSAILTLAFGLALLTGCVDNNETPPPDVPFSTGTFVPISQVKALYDTELGKDWFDRSPVEITEDWSIRGIVTGSDKKDGNLYKEGFIEDQSSGVLLKFESTGGFYLGDSVVINVKGLYIGDYGDFIQIGGVPYTDASGNYRVSGFNKDERMKKIAVNRILTPADVTIEEIENGDYLGRLVRLTDVQFSGSEEGKTYADPLADPPASANRYLNDCNSNTIIVRSSGYSSFAGDLLPTGKGSITGIVTIFNSDHQIIIRDINEVDMTGERCMSIIGTLGNPVDTVNVNFEEFSDYDDIDLTGWQNVIASGGRYWIARYFSGESNHYASASAYKSGSASMEAWLVTPPITVSVAKTLTFRSAMAYWTHDPADKPLELFYSADYDGTNLSSATWVPLNATLATSTNANYEWVPSGNIALPVLPGQSVVIGFRYTGSDPDGSSGDKTTSAIIDNIIIKP